MVMQIELIVVVVVVVVVVWNRPALKHLNVRLKAAKNFAQSKCKILHALRKLRKKRARKTSIVQADSKVTFHTISISIRHLSRAISRVWPVNT